MPVAWPRLQCSLLVVGKRAWVAETPVFPLWSGLAHIGMEDSEAPRRTARVRTARHRNADRGSARRSIAGHRPRIRKIAATVSGAAFRTTVVGRPAWIGDYDVDLTTWDCMHGDSLGITCCGTLLDGRRDRHPRRGRWIRCRTLERCVTKGE